MRERFEPIVDERPDDTPWPKLSWPPAPGTVLAGPVVTLTPTDAASDAAALFAALDNEAVWAHVTPRPRSTAEWTSTIEFRQGTGFFPWTVRLAQPLAGLPANSVVGITSYLDISVSDARLEIGWTAYTPAVWGGLVNPAAKFLLLEHAFTTLGAGRVQLKTDIRNHRSQQAIHRLGASYEGVLRRYQRRSDDTMRDTVMFGLPIEEWPAARADLLARLND